MAIPIIEVKNLTKTYTNGEVETLAVRENSFTIEKGEFVAIMGPSGSGKSTLMQMIGLLDRPTAGEYLLEGENIKNLSDNEMAEIRNSKIGFVFQTFNLLPRTSVYENVELPLLYNQDKSNKENRAKITQALRSVGMEHRTEYLSNQLSGGEKQRVAIARALVTNPEIIFADEPTGNLDSKSGIQIMQILQKLNDEGHTIILVTHETFTAQHAKRIINVKDGKIVSDELVKDRRRAVEGELLK
ncbi:MAG: ABC transporter ATP-binding protein [Candidatus Moraniibacteriota bacterium]